MNERIVVSGKINAEILKAWKGGAKNVDEIAFSIGLPNLCRFFHWQGGTIHQAKKVLELYLNSYGIFEKDGELMVLGLVAGV